jgi:putative acyl-CoA dehydrogenase
VADAFVASRLADDGGSGPFPGWGSAFGTLPSGVDTAAIVARFTPDLTG